MVHRIQNRNPGYSDFSNLGVNTSFNFANTNPVSSGANALKLENEVMQENIQDTVANNHVNQINDVYHEELLKNQEMENVIKNISEDDENSFTKDVMGDPLKENEINKDNDLKEFGVDNDAPDLFNSENEISNTEELISSENEGHEDDLEIPAFLRRQKN